jgi:hypothetical protein
MQSTGYESPVDHPHRRQFRRSISSIVRLAAAENGAGFPRFRSAAA